MLVILALRMYAAAMTGAPRTSGHNEIYPKRTEDDDKEETMAEAVETVRVKVAKPQGSGRREGWNKLVTSVDDTKSGGYAFQGRFLDERQEDLKVGSILVGQIPVGSARDGNHWRVGIVGGGGVEWEATTWPLDNFLDFRDHVKGLLCKPEDTVKALKAERERLLHRIQELDQLIEQAEQGGE